MEPAWKSPVLTDRLNLTDLAERALAAAGRRNLTIATAESCTAGKLSALLSEAPGAGEHLHGSFVTYTKANKVQTLGVDAGLLKAKGAVCREVAVAMAEGALHRSPADVAVAITGVAGPDPDETRPRRAWQLQRGPQTLRAYFGRIILPSVHDSMQHSRVSSALWPLY